MKVIFNTRQPKAIASYHYINPLKSLKEFSFNDRESYDQYDIALFMTYPEDLEDLAAAKRKHPLLKVGLVDPRGSQIERYVNYVDFFVVDSIEMKDFFARYDIPILMYQEYPNITTVPKIHKQKKPIIIGYHGNKLHLSAMYPNVTKALELLGKRYKIEFWAMYQRGNTGECRLGLPENIPVRHVEWSHLQWNDNNVADVFPHIDIGIAPALMPIVNHRRIKRKARIWRDYFNDNNDDYLIRFKMPTNSCRIVCFGKLGIPVVADFYPSALQCIRDGENGLLAYSTGGWYRALESLILDYNFRQKVANNMLLTVQEKFDFEKQNERFLTALTQIKSLKEPRERETIEQSVKSLRNHTGFWREMLKYETSKLKTYIFKHLPETYKWILRKRFKK